MSILKWRGQDAQIPIRGLQPSTQNAAPAKTRTINRPKRVASVWRRMDGLEWRAIQALAHVRFPVGSIHKRVARNLAHQLEIVEITDKQAAYLWALVWRYRRQIRSADLVEHARRLTQPKTDAAFLQ